MTTVYVAQTQIESLTMYYLQINLKGQVGIDSTENLRFVHFIASALVPLPSITPSAQSHRWQMSQQFSPCQQN